MPAEISHNLDELLETFDLLDGWDERYGYLIELGYQLPPLPAEDQTEENRVEGCLSTVWLVSVENDAAPPTLTFRADSDSVIVKGLLAVLLTIYSGRTPQEILALNAEAIFATIGFQSHLSARRRNGLHAMVERIREFARQRV